jgi:hypothetical protein
MRGGDDFAFRNRKVVAMRERGGEVGLAIAGQVDAVGRVLGRGCVVEGLGGSIAEGR